LAAYWTSKALLFGFFAEVKNLETFPEDEHFLK
jgi:hypothetical protein